MNDSPNFASILDEAPTEVLRPPPLPKGTYLWRVGQWELRTVGQDGKQLVEFQMQCLAPGDDVDEEELAEAGGCEGKFTRVTFWLEDAYKLDEFHENCGLDLEEPASRRQRNDEVMNAQVYGYNKPRPDKNDKEKFYTNITKTAPA